MSPSEQERLCLRVKGLLAGRGNTLAMSKVPLFDFAGLVDSDLLFCTKKKASAFLQAIFTWHHCLNWLKSLAPLLNQSDAQQKNRLHFLALRHFHAPGLAIQISRSHWSSTRKSRLKFWFGKHTGRNDVTRGSCLHLISNTALHRTFLS